MQYKILHIEDSKTDADLIKRLLQKSGMKFHYYWAENKESYLKGLSEFEPDVILSDHQMPQFSSEMAFEICKEKKPDVPFILVTGTVSEEFAVMMMKSGLDDYLLKTNLQRLPQAIINTVSKRTNDRKIREVEAELKQSEANLRTIFENTAKGFILVTFNGDVIEMNARANYFTNIAWKKKLKKNDNIFEVIPEFRRKHLEKEIEEALHGKKVTFESTFELNGQGSKYFEVNVGPIRDADGIVTGYCITLDDTTERRRNEKKLRQLSQAVEQSPASVVITDTKGNIQYVNSKFTSITGYRSKEVMGKNSNILKSGHTPQSEYARLWRNITSGIDWRGEFLNKKKNGDFYWEMALISPIFNADGEIINFLAVKEDITERKKAEEEILRSQRQFQGMIENISGVYWIVNLDTYQTLYVSPSYEKMFGRKRDEIYKDSQKWIEVIHPDDKEEVFAKYGAGAKKISYRIIKPDGETRWIAANMNVIVDGKGKRIQYGYAEDITDSKIAEEEILQKNQQLSLLSDHLQNIREEERSNIAREIHDELGQQLTVMKMDISMLQKKLAEKKSTDLTLYDLTGLVDQTIETVRRLAFELRPCMLDDLGLCSTSKWYAKEFEKRTGIKIFITSDKKEKTFDKKITTNLFRIFQECLTNIARHANATEVKIEMKTSADNFQMTICDNGKGFDTSVANNKTLGILGMKERAATINGEYTIESTKGQGTIVKVKVPVHFNEKASNNIAS